MGQIYSRADRVITYLGPTGSVEEECNGLCLLRRLNEQFPENHDIYEKIHKIRNMSPARRRLQPDTRLLGQLPEDLRVLDGDTDQELSRRYIDQGWKWLLEVSFGEWTQRLWMVQVCLFDDISIPNILSLMLGYSVCNLSIVRILSQRILISSGASFLTDY
jgi:heterokaryon incompatibility protein (HET)